MLTLYHRGVALQPSAGRSGKLFVSCVSILEEDGEETVLRELGAFPSRDAALQFALTCGTAFVDGEPLPIAPQSVVRDEESKNAGL
ncbi:hypothetical protein [Caballeronia sp. TF1N1]|uniref:hypothetical protein n=1 Tax=Caballeronia sp. TF1N1 TaxID=2878153 RepID=UPI001FD34F36|nr:hypothetical protein [Caballeronia sp. TF1N1]